MNEDAQGGRALVQGRTAIALHPEPAQPNQRSILTF